MSNNKIFNIGDELKKTHSKQLNLFTYMCPDDRKYIEIGNLIKYINIHDLRQKIKTGIVINITLDNLILKSVCSSTTWKIKLTDHHIFYKFRKDDLIDAINELLEKNEKNNK
jgi:hypothetical protein